MQNRTDYSLARVNGRYHVVWYDEGGNRQRRSLSTDDGETAQARLIEFKRVASLAQASTPTSVEEIYLAYAAKKEADGKPSAPRIKDAWKRLKPFFAATAPHQIDELVCKEYFKRRIIDGVNNGTIHIELGYLRAAMNYAVTKGWLTQAPFIPLPRKPDPKDHHLTRDEVHRLIDAAAWSHVRLFIILAVTTAARSGAILDLTWDRIDMERRKVMLHNPARQVTNKGRATVPMNTTLYEALVEAKAGALSSYVIEWGGQKVASVKKSIAAAAKRAGVTCSPHVLRHTAAVWMAESGVPMEQIAQFLGHSNVDTTRRIYARFSPDYLRGAAAALELDQDTDDRRVGARR